MIASKNGFYYALASLGIIVVLFNFSATAENIFCRSANHIPLNNWFHGVWFEAARTNGNDISGDKNASCTTMNISKINNEFFVSFTFRPNSTGLMVNKTIQQKASINRDTFEFDFKSYKIIETDNKTYAFICDSMKIGHGFILTRDRKDSNVTKYMQYAKAKFTDFQNLSQVNQTYKCASVTGKAATLAPVSGAATFWPMLTMLLTVVIADLLRL